MRLDPDLLACLFEHYAGLDWFATPASNENAGTAFRGLAELGDAVSKLDLPEGPPQSIEQWHLENENLLDCIRWHAFKTLDSSVGNLMSLVGESCQLETSLGNELDWLGESAGSGQPDLAPLVRDEMIPPDWRSHIATLQEASIKLSREIVDGVSDFARGRFLLYQGFLVCMDVLRLVRSVEYALLLRTLRKHRENEGGQRTTGVANTT
jgi:hypothetical protein